jgi:hypothetical protein
MTTYAQLTLQCFFLLQLVVNVFGVLLQRFRESLKVSLVLMWTSICTTIKWSTQHTFNLLEPSKIPAAGVFSLSHFFPFFWVISTPWLWLGMLMEIGTSAARNWSLFLLDCVAIFGQCGKPSHSQPTSSSVSVFFPLILPYSYTISGFIGSYNKSIQSDTQVLEQ